MTNNYSHIHPDFRHVMAASDAERLAFLAQPRWIGYPRAIHIIETLDLLMKTPARPRMPNLLIVWESNNGKTTIIRRFLEMRGKGRIENVEPVKPIILAG